MGKMNVPRIVLGGVVAGILCFIGDGIVHGTLLKQLWAEAMLNLGRKAAAEPPPVHMVYYLAYDLAKALVGVWLYAAIRPRFGAGPRTAVIAAVATWALVIPISVLGILPAAFFGRRLALWWSVDGLVVMVIAIVIGAWLYKEGDGAATAKS